MIEIAFDADATGSTRWLILYRGWMTGKPDTSTRDSLDSEAEITRAIKSVTEQADEKSVRLKAGSAMTLSRGSRKRLLAAVESATWERAVLDDVSDTLAWLESLPETPAAEQPEKE